MFLVLFPSAMLRLFSLVDPVSLSLSNARRVTAAREDGADEEEEIRRAAWQLQIQDEAKARVEESHKVKRMSAPVAMPASNSSGTIACVVQLRPPATAHEATGSRVWVGKASQGSGERYGAAVFGNLALAASDSSKPCPRASRDRCGRGHDASPSDVCIIGACPHLSGEGFLQIAKRGLMGSIGGWRPSGCLASFSLRWFRWRR